MLQLIIRNFFYSLAFILLIYFYNQPVGKFSMEKFHELMQGGGPIILLMFFMAIFSLFDYIDRPPSSTSSLIKISAIERMTKSGGPRTGVLKRIDENRELLEALQLHAPGLLKDRPWIEWWIKGNDDFFVELAEILEVKPPPNLKNYPRAWSGK